MSFLILEKRYIGFVGYFSMVKAKEFTKDVQAKNTVIQLYKTSKGYKKMLKDLKMPINTVQTLIKKWKIWGSVNTKSWSRRMACTTAGKICREKEKPKQFTWKHTLF